MLVLYRETDVRSGRKIPSYKWLHHPGGATAGGKCREPLSTFRSTSSAVFTRRRAAETFSASETNGFE